MVIDCVWRCCRFWLAVQDFKRRPLHEVPSRAQEIWQEFLAEGAPSSINLDSHSYERTSQNLKDPGRYSYEDAQVGGGDRWTHVALRAHFWFILALFFAQIYFEFTSNLLYTASPVTTHKLVCFPSNRLNSPYSCYTTEWMRARMNKKKEEKGGMTECVCVGS